jgi:NAD(P)-dependent dehydrogenase (short-subunit alcohol dehydrogenase family)
MVGFQLRTPTPRSLTTCKRCIHYWQATSGAKYCLELTLEGAAAGIGRAVALRLIADGIKNVALIDLIEAHLADIAAKIVELDPSIEVLKIGADCSKEYQVDSAVEKTVATFGRLDICFNGAGIPGTIARTADINSDNLDAVLGVNLKGVWYCERAQVGVGADEFPNSDCFVISF